jgi:DNA-binding MarR family transcriptional regulator
MEQELNLPLTWYDVLHQLAFAPGERMRMQQLSDALVLTRTGATRLIDRIEKAGLVRREPAAEDRRGYYAVLTDAGRSAVDAASKLHGASIDTQFSQFLNQKDLKRLHAMMAKVQQGNPNLSGTHS